MSRFIENPHLPQGRVTLAAVSGRNTVINKELENIGIELIKTLPYNNEKSNPEADHADMQLLHLGGNKVIVLSNKGGLADELTKVGISVKFANTEINKFCYPQCAVLNCVVLKGRIFGLVSNIDRVVIDCFSDNEKVNVKQGYTKCSTCVVNENAIITSDSTISKAAMLSGIDCLKIEEGYIQLCDKYPGFIGGASFKYDSSTLLFTGDIKQHPNYLSIRDFCKNHGVFVQSLTSLPLTDVGGVVVLKEE
ncbi:MAG: hypothetical protein K2M82_06130 [Lachnospiraceae bacterium]|nr:hypothetical protein [Lachnospiraceae bacterium]